MNGEIRTCCVQVVRELKRTTYNPSMTILVSS
jgi:hypothetical protein